MSRNLKALGLALIAAFAMSAFVSSAAQATPNPLAFTAEQHPATLTGTEINWNGHEDHSFTLSSGRVITCKIAEFHGTIVNSSEDEIATLTPNYKECTGGGGLPATLTMEGCDYSFHGGTEISTHHFNEGTVDLGCPGVESVVIHVYSNATNHANNTSICTYTIPPFINKGENTFVNTTGISEGSEDVDITSNWTGIPVKKTFGSVLLCGPETQTLTYRGATTLIAEEDEDGFQYDLTVSEP